jgi:hypothetical protein
MVKSMTPQPYDTRIDINNIAEQLIKENLRTVDSINIAIRDAIAEVIYFDKHGSFKTFNSFKGGLKMPKKRKVGFNPEPQKAIAIKAEYPVTEDCCVKEIILSEN